MAWAGASAAHAEGAPSRQELTYELANTYRILADEQFLNGRREAAEASYLQAQAAAAGLKAGSGFVADSDVVLMRDEIAYRRTLLRYGASFWGFEHQMRPQHPVASWRELDTTFKEFAAQVAEIDRLVAQLQASSDAQVSDELSALQASEQGAVSVLESQAADTSLRYADLRRGMLRDRMETIASRQAQIAAERGPLLAQLDSAAAGLNATLTGALSSYVGLPPDTMSLVQGAARGDVTATLEAAVQAYAASGGVEMDGALGELALSAHEAAQQYAEIKSTVRSAQAMADQGARLVKAVQSRDTAAMLDAGGALYRSLPDDARREVEDALAANRTVQSVASLARQGTALREQVAAYVATAPQLSAIVRPVLRSYLDTASDEFDRYYGLALSTALDAATSAQERQDVLVRLARAWPETVVDDLLPDEKAMVATAVALGSPCRDATSCRAWLIARLRTQGLTGPVAVDPAGKVKISNPANQAVVAEFDLRALADKAVRRPVEQGRERLRADADAILANLDREQGKLMSRLLAKLPDTDFDRRLAPLLTGLSPAEASAAVAAISPPRPEGDVLTASLASFSLGRDLANRTVLKPSGPAPGPAPRQPGPEAAGQEQMMLQALAATGPYGAAAATAVKILSGMEAMADIADQARELDKEDRALTAELLHLAPLQAEVDRDEALAILAKRIAETRAGGAVRRGELLQTALQQKGQRATALEAKIRSRLPLTYYLAEILRERYDRLDQSLALWTGDVGSSGSRMESLLRGDPRTARLALDPDIRFYDWFDRTSEGQRQDLDRLLTHWSQLRTAAGQVCSNLGCSINSAQMGTAFASQPVDAAALVEDLGAAGAPRRVRFTLLPQHLSDLPQVDRLLLVTVAGVIRDRATNAPAAGTNFRIRHSGLGYLRVDGEGRREALESSTEAPLEYLPRDEDVERRRQALQGRWLGNDRLGDLEGYPLFGLYELTVPGSFDPKRQKLELRFFYQRPNVSAPIDAGAPEKLVACGGENGQTEIPAGDLVLLVSAEPQATPSVLRGGGLTCTVRELQP